MRHIKQLMFFFLAAFGLTSCLKEDDMNIDPDNLTQNILTIEWPEAGVNSINSGMQYFSGGNLLYSGTDEVDTATVYVKLAGAHTLDHDITFKLGVDDSRLLINYDNDSINYLAMPDSVYNILEESVTLKAGERFATFHIEFLPSKFDASQNYMLPVTVAETGGIALSENFGHIYFHRMYNPIAGAYLWDYKRYQTATQDPAFFHSSSFVGHDASFIPVSGTTIMAGSGYINAQYLISFSDDGAGNLSDFTAVLDPAAFTANAVELISGPTLTVSADQKKFTLNYVAFNGADFRNITDEFHK
jgi:hypothetical protein